MGVGLCAMWDLVSELYGSPTEMLISPIVSCCLSGPLLYIREHTWTGADAREGVTSRLKILDPC